MVCFSHGARHRNTSRISVYLGSVLRNSRTRDSNSGGLSPLSRFFHNRGPYGLRPIAMRYGGLIRRLRAGKSIGLTQERPI